MTTGIDSTPNHGGELFAIARSNVGGVSIETVDARELHAYLENGDHFATWIKDRIAQYGFFENLDFVTYSEPTEKGRPRQNWAISIEMAKELAMVERNERGKEARVYFIECERQAKARTVINVRDPAQLASIAIQLIEVNRELADKVSIMAPKAEFHDAVAVAVNAQPLSEVAQVLGTGQNRLFAMLRQAGILKGGNQPYQPYVDQGYFKVIEKTRQDRAGNWRTYTQTLVTGHGLSWIQRRFFSAEAAA